ncbi:MAG: helix-turn-helix domain-containing protein [Ignavibacteriaceae bacterium]
MFLFSNVRLLVLITFVLTVVNLTHAQPDFDKLFNSLKNAEKGEQRVLIDSVLRLLVGLDVNSGEKLTEKLLQITSSFEDSYPYIKVLAFQYRFGNNNERTESIYKAYRLAKKENDKQLIAHTLVILGENCQRREIYDSTMICVLMANELYEELGDNTSQVVILHKLGDLFYEANLLNKAGFYYNKVMQLKGDDFDWLEWRKFVITNNLGLIETRRGNLQKAYYFFQSALMDLLKSKQDNLNSSDSVRIVHSYLSLAENTINSKNFISAKLYLEKVLLFNTTVNWAEYWKRYYLLSGRLAYLESQFDLSLKLLNKSVSIDPELHYSTFSVTIFKYLSDSYEKVGDLKSALNNNRLYNLYVDSLNIKRNLKSAVYLLMNDNLRKSHEEISGFRNNQIILLTSIIIISVFILIISLFYTKLRKANKFLVKKNLELLNQNQFFSNTISEQSTFKSSASSFITDSNPSIETKEHIQDSSKSHEDCSKVTEIKRRLEKAMNEQELFKETYLTLDSLAHELGTNRALLSKLINTVYGIPFNTYINNLRIKKSIEIIKHRTDYDTNHKLDHILKTVGFSNRTTFISAFKAFSGLTPSAFIKNLPKNL